MNEIAHGPNQLPTTQAAEGLPRLKWSLARFEQLIELGVFTKHDRLELIGGELVPMSAKGNRHEVVRDEIHQWLSDNRPKGVRHSIEIGWRPDGETYIEPDILIFPSVFKANTVPAAEVLLLIEVADSSLSYDAGRKAMLYASLGVREYWVVNAKTLETRVYRTPVAAIYGEVTSVGCDKLLESALAAGVAFRLADLDLG